LIPPDSSIKYTAELENQTASEDFPADFLPVPDCISIDNGYIMKNRTFHRAI
jgi:hypothetical protein